MRTTIAFMWDLLGARTYVRACSLRVSLARMACSINCPPVDDAV